MDKHEIELRLKNIDERTTRIEQILPTLATKADLKAFATKDDLKAFATKDDLKAFATKEDVRACPTRDQMWTAIHEEGRITRAHFDVVAEGLRESIKGIAEGHKVLDAKIDNLGSEVKKVLRNHERRITALEADPLKRRSSGR